MRRNWIFFLENVHKNYSHSSPELRSKWWIHRHEPPIYSIYSQLRSQRSSALATNRRPQILIRPRTKSYPKSNYSERSLSPDLSRSSTHTHTQTHTHTYRYSADLCPSAASSFLFSFRRCRGVFLCVFFFLLSFVSHWAHAVQWVVMCFSKAILYNACASHLQYDMWCVVPVSVPR